MAATEVRGRRSRPFLQRVRSNLGGGGLAAARALIVLILMLLPAAPSARADEASGTWTGRIETRGSYYWERSTRVVAPTLGVRVESPRGVAMQAQYLVDSITSASVAAGALVDVGFTEIRHDLTLGVGGEIDVGDQHVQLNGGAHFSREPDYESYSGNGSVRVALDDRNTTLGLATSVLHDSVHRVFRTGSQIAPPNMAAAFNRSFEAITFSPSVEHILNPRSLIVAGYDLARASGYLASPYRQVPVGGVLMPESHPDLRVRHTLWARYQLAVPRAHGAMHMLVRGYADSWNVRAVSLETRWYQELGPFAVARLRYRYYTQTAAFFDSGQVPATYSGTPTYFTADGKMQRFHDQEFGLGMITRLGFLTDSGLRWFSRTEIEFSVDYRVSTNRFGNAVIGALVVRMPID